ncbi:MAG: bifunctional isocitrate dehydrogenase kinase/phosphatase, partial [Candidatus Omnitrophica bacterium]|nr:bifunctional isocitrate dehydrogenase kinase/phosphatase [Candidatus Omnitrophota bacterium]
MNEWIKWVKDGKAPRVTHYAPRLKRTIEEKLEAIFGKQVRDEMMPRLEHYLKEDFRALKGSQKPYDLFLRLRMSTYRALMYVSEHLAAGAIEDTELFTPVDIPGYTVSGPAQFGAPADSGLGQKIDKVVRQALTHRLITEAERAELEQFIRKEWDHGGNINFPRLRNAWKKRAVRPISETPSAEMPESTAGRQAEAPTGIPQPLSEEGLIKPSVRAEGGSVSDFSGAKDIDLAEKFGPEFTSAVEVDLQAALIAENLEETSLKLGELHNRIQEGINAFAATHSDELRTALTALSARIGEVQNLIHGVLEFEKLAPSLEAHQIEELGQALRQCRELLQKLAGDRYQELKARLELTRDELVRRVTDEILLEAEILLEPNTVFNDQETVSTAARLLAMAEMLQEGHQAIAGRLRRFNERLRDRIIQMSNQPAMVAQAVLDAPRFQTLFKDYADRFRVSREFLQLAAQSGQEPGLLEKALTRLPKARHFSESQLGSAQAGQGTETGKVAKKPRMLLQHEADLHRSVIRVAMLLEAARSETRPLEERLVRIIQEDYDAYYEEFKAITRRAQSTFETRNWHQAIEDAQKRARLFHNALDQSETAVRKILQDRVNDRLLWERMRDEFKRGVVNRYDADLGMAYFYGLMRRMFLKEGVPIEYSGEEILGQSPAEAEPPYRTYTARQVTPDLLKAIVQDFHLNAPFEDLDRDAKLAGALIDSDFRSLFGQEALLDRIEVLKPLFFRNKGAYIVARIYSQGKVLPLVLVLLNPERGVGIDAVLTQESDISNIFSSARANFHVEAGNYREIVDFLQMVAATRTRFYLYSAIGFVHPAKLEFVRNLRQHMQDTGETFERAVGIPGSVTEVFTLPTYPYVFKVIRDWSKKRDYPGRDRVIEKYRMVHEMDRFGCMLDPMAFYNLEFPKAAF